MKNILKLFLIVSCLIIGNTIWAQEESEDGSEDGSNLLDEECATLVISGKNKVCLGENVTFTATVTPSTLSDGVTWSDGGEPATGTGATFTTKWTVKGAKTITAKCGSVTKTFDLTVSAIESEDMYPPPPGLSWGEYKWEGLEIKESAQPNNGILGLTEKKHPDLGSMAIVCADSDSEKYKIIGCYRVKMISYWYSSQLRTNAAYAIQAPQSIALVKAGEKEHYDDIKEYFETIKAAFLEASGKEYDTFAEAEAAQNKAFAALAPAAAKLEADTDALDGDGKPHQALAEQIIIGN